MSRLRRALESKYATEGSVVVTTPQNRQLVELEFRSRKVAKITGSMANEPPVAGKILSGLLVKRDGDVTYQIIATEDISEFTSITANTVKQRLTVRISLLVLCGCLLILSLCVAKRSPSTKASRV